MFPCKILATTRGTIHTKRKRETGAESSDSSEEMLEQRRFSKRTFERTESTTSTLVDEQSDAETVTPEMLTDEAENKSSTASDTRPAANLGAYPHIYSHARALLRCSSQGGDSRTSRLVGRHAEREAVTSFLRDRLSFNSSTQCKSITASGAMYIAGTPGTGKTALVCDVAASFSHEADVAIVNCVALASASDVYAKILSSLPSEENSTPRPKKGRKADPLPSGTPEQQLISRLASPRRNTIVVLDEMDNLLRSGWQQDVLYKLFLAVSPAHDTADSVKPPSRRSTVASKLHARTALIGIANSLDLAENFLPLLTGYKAYPQLLSFTPFSVDDIVAIVSSRLAHLYARYDVDPLESIKSVGSEDAIPVQDELPIFTKPGLRLAAMKVAAVTGDLRKALDVCRLAIETVEKAQKDKGIDMPSLTRDSAARVGPPHVLSAVARAFPTSGSTPGTPAGASLTNMARVRALPLHAGLLLASYLLVDFGHCHLGPKGGSIDVAAVYDKYTRTLLDDGSFTPLPMGEVLDILANLETQAFLDLSAPRASVAPSQAKGASRAALRAMAKRMPGGAAGGGATTPALGARSQVVTLRMPLQDVRRALTDPSTLPASAPTPGSGKTVAAETIARLMHTEERRLLRNKGWEQAAAGFEEKRKNELGGGRLAVAQGL